MSVIRILQMRAHRLPVRLTWDEARRHTHSLTFLKVLKTAWDYHRVGTQKTYILQWCPTLPQPPGKSPIFLLRALFNPLLSQALGLGELPLREPSMALFGSPKSSSLRPGRLWRTCSWPHPGQVTCPPIEHTGPSGMWWERGPGSSLCETEVRTLLSSPQRSQIPEAWISL